MFEQGCKYVYGEYRKKICDEIVAQLKISQAFPLSEFTLIKVYLVLTTTIFIKAYIIAGLVSDSST